MSYDLNCKKLKEFSGKNVYLFDSSAYCRYDELSLYANINFFDVISQLDGFVFLMTNEVCVELMKGPRVLPPKFLLDHIINVESAMDHSWKENRFLYEVEGKLTYFELNKISAVDWGQVLLCQNHPELTLITNDRKMLKSAGVVLGKRVMGAASFIDHLVKKYPTNQDLKKIKKVSGKLFETKKLS